MYESVTLVTKTSPFVNISPGVWTHIVGVYDGANVYLYCNGLRVGAGTPFTGQINISIDPLDIGTQKLDADRYFSGPIDDALIYNRALSAKEILMHYNIFHD